LEVLLPPTQRLMRRQGLIPFKERTLDGSRVLLVELRARDSAMLM